MALVLGSKTFTCYASSHLFQHTRGFKSALKIKWVRPEKVPFNDPKMTGDLAPLGTIDMSQFPTPWKASNELQSANEDIKRIHTLEFFPRKVLKEEFIQLYTSKVKSHQLDDDSIEVRLARLTVTIRNLQVHYEKFRQDKQNKTLLKELIDKRHQMLERLKHQDYKKYEWLLEKLDLEHKVYKAGGEERVERKRSLRRLTMLYIEKVKSERLQEYKVYLESQKEGFLKDKLEKLIWMKKTEEECGVPQTVTDEEIETVRKQLQELEVTKPKEVVE